MHSMSMDSAGGEDTSPTVLDGAIGIGLAADSGSSGSV